MADTKKSRIVSLFGSFYIPAAIFFFFFFWSFAFPGTDISIHLNGSIKASVVLILEMWP